MKYIYLATIFFISAMASCTQEIDIDLGKTEPELVVDGAISDDAAADTIMLKKSSDYFYNKPAEMVSNAVVTLTDSEGNSYSIQEDTRRKGCYFTPTVFTAVAGRRYTLNISNVDINNDGVKETYTSESVLNKVPAIDSMSVVKNRILYQDSWAIRISMQDPEKTKDFYLFRTYINGVCNSDSISEWGATDDQFFNGKYLISESVMYLFSEKPDEKVKSGDTITIEMNSITEDYLYYIYQVVDEYRGRNPLFGGQPANVKTNIKRTIPTSTDGKGARGFFTIYTTVRKSFVYKE